MPIRGGISRRLKGNQGAQRSEGVAEHRMTRAQIAEAQRMSTEWLEAHPSGGN